MSVRAWWQISAVHSTLWATTSRNVRPAARTVLPTRPGRPATGGLSDWTWLAITAAGTLPILWMGYGTDIDVGDVLESAELIRRFDYAPSRNPGVPVFETIVAVLDPIEGLSQDRVDAGGDYFSAMRSNLTVLREALGCR